MTDENHIFDTEEESHRDNIDALHRVGETLCRYHDLLLVASRNGSTTSELVTAVRLGADSTLGWVNGTPLPVMSLEGLTDNGLTVTLEAIDSKVKMAWDALKAALKHFFTWCKELVTRLFSSKKEVSERADAVVALLQNKKEQFAATPPAATMPRYPYSELSNEEIKSVILDDTIPTNWSVAVPKIFERYSNWLTGTVETVITKEKSLIPIYEKSRQEFTQNLANKPITEQIFSSVDAVYKPLADAYIETINQIDSLLATQPPLVDGGEFRNARMGPERTAKYTLVRQYTDINEIKEKRRIEFVCHSLQFWTTNLSGKLEVVNLTELISSLNEISRIAENSSKLGQVERDIKQYYSALEAKVNAVPLPHPHAERDFKYLSLVSGTEIQTLLLGWNKLMGLMHSYIVLVKKIATIHMTQP
nr:MAG: internal head protein [Bacteriophage sp.]